MRMTSSIRIGLLVGMALLVVDAVVVIGLDASWTFSAGKLLGALLLQGLAVAGLIVLIRRKGRPFGWESRNQSPGSTLRFIPVAALVGIGLSTALSFQLLYVGTVCPDADAFPARGRPLCQAPIASRAKTNQAAQKTASPPVERTSP